MQVLVVDTSQTQPLVCILKDKKIIAEKTGTAFHSELLFSLIEDVLKKSNTTLKEMDAFGVGIGPGSFTGLRVGCVAVRTFAQLLNKPIYSFSSLQALYYSAIQQFQLNQTTEGLVAMTNAYQGQAFIGCYHSNKWQETIAEPMEWLKLRLSTEQTSIKICGSYIKQDQIDTMNDQVALLQTENITPVGIARLLDNEKIKSCSYLELQVNYLRPSAAEMKYQKLYNKV